MIGLCHFYQAQNLLSLLFYIQSPINVCLDYDTCTCYLLLSQAQ